MVSSPNRRVFQTVIVLTIYFTNCKNGWFLCIERSDSLSEGVKRRLQPTPFRKRIDMDNPTKFSLQESKSQIFHIPTLKNQQRKTICRKTKDPSPSQKAKRQERTDIQEQNLYPTTIPGVFDMKIPHIADFKNFVYM